MAENSSGKMMPMLLENGMMLPRDIFDYQNKMHDDVRAQFGRIIDFAKERFLTFLNCPIEDVVLFGKLCSSVHRSDTKADVAFVLKTSLPQKTLDNIAFSIPARGYHLFIYNHEIVFHLLKAEDVIGANWSLIQGKWNQEPQIRQFSFNMHHFSRAYDLYAKETHDILDHLPQTADGFYTPESCDKIRQYLKYLKDNALFALKYHPEHEYSMAYNLYLAFDEIFGVRALFEEAVAKAESHLLEDLNDA